MPLLAPALAGRSRSIRAPIRTGVIWQYLWE